MPVGAVRRGWTKETSDYVQAERGFENKRRRERGRSEEGAVRGLRQRRAYYRCCIPALAGFVSQRSIAPDGSIPMDQLEQKGNGFLAACRASVFGKEFG